jgi:hypothetical protein
MNNISTIIPVGPDPAYKLYLLDAIKSVVEQMEFGDEILVVDDMAHLNSEFFAAIPAPEGSTINYVRNDWLLGCDASWNIGVALARNELCILMGSDDLLLPGCFAALREAYDQNDHRDAWYHFTIRLDNGEVHSAFNNAAGVTKGLWKWIGGFPPSAGIGGPDALLISIMMIHGSEKLIQVKEGTPLYWVRQHAAQDTKRLASTFCQQVIDVRNIETARFVPNPGWALFVDSVQSRVDSK